MPPYSGVLRIKRKYSGTESWTLNRPADTRFRRRRLTTKVCSPALCGVPVILDGVVGSSGEDLGDLRPLVAVHAVGAHEDVLLCLRPRVLLDGWV